MHEYYKVINLVARQIIYHKGWVTDPRAVKKVQIVQMGTNISVGK